MRSYQGLICLISRITLAPLPESVLGIGIIRGGRGSLPPLVTAQAANHLPPAVMPNISPKWPMNGLLERGAVLASLEALSSVVPNLTGLDGTLQPLPESPRLGDWGLRASDLQATAQKETELSAFEE